MPDTEKPQLVRQHYERWPYPHIPLFAQVPSEQLWQLNAHWLAAKSGRKLHNDAPRIWIAGCGTFQPYLMAQANPGSSILATDWSESSLRRAKQRGFWHRLRGVEYAQLDLNRPETFPSGPFDFIESYGVLMILKDPARTLKAFRERLRPGGICRVMVYPHYGRQRVFQIQRLATILGLNSGEKEHPEILRDLMRRLPDSHPLKYAFLSYPDSKNLVGIADGFLHAGDRGFTGIELCRIIEEAGFELGYAVHRPWGQPGVMAEKLGMPDKDPAFWLHYLDLWQSLKSNYILTLIRKDEAGSAPTSFRHAVFNPRKKGMSVGHRLRLMRMGLTGARLQSRTHEAPLKLSAKAIRALGSGRKLSETEALYPFAEPLGKPFQSTEKNFHPWHEWNLGLEENSPNPLYAPLFDAYRWTAGGRLRSLAEQIEAWSGHARELEDDVHPFGLTPFGTYRANPELVNRALNVYQRELRLSFRDARLKDEATKFREVEGFLKDFPLGCQHFSDAEKRELWVLLFSYPHLTLQGEA